MGCAFCDIVDGTSPASVVYSDGMVMAIMDIQPIVPGHMLVMPREHAVLMSQMAPGVGSLCFTVAARCAEALRTSGMRCEGVNLWVADGEAAFQDVPHFHIHVIPRYAGDGFTLGFPANYSVPTERSALDDAAARIRRGLS